MTTRDERASRKSRNGSGAADDEHWRFIRAISNGDLKGLESVLISIRESPDCFKLLSRESSSGQHALHYTLSDINLQRTQELESRIEIVKSIIESISENQRLEYFNLRDTTDRRTALHTAAVHKELDVVKAILRSLPVNDRLALIDEKDGARKKVLEYALSEEIRQVIETFTRTNTSTKPTVEINNESAANNVEEWTDVRPRYPANFSDPNFDLHDNDFDTVAWPGKELGKVSSTSEPLEPESLSAEDAFKKIDDLLKQVKQDRSFAKIVHLRNKYGLTILHVAVMKNRADIVEKILTCIPSSDSHWMLISQICNHGKTALHYASMNAAITIVKLLIRYCDYKRRWDLISKICDVHKTSLHYASMAGSLDTVQELLGHCGEKDFELTRITDDKHHAPAKYAHSLEVRTLLSRVETHYWKTFFKPPTVLTFYNAFTNSVKRREGAEDEKNKMMEAFRSCGMDPKDYPDFTETMIKDKIDKAISDDNGATSALIVAVLSHGEKGMVYDADHRPIRLQRIIDIISSSSRLEFFPKVLFLQSCKEDSAKNKTPVNSGPIPSGSNSQYDVMVADDNEPTSNPDFCSYEIQGTEFCLISSTLQGRKSIRGLMADKLKAAICRPNGPVYLADIYQAINRAMRWQQVPEIHGTLGRKLAFKRPKERTLFSRFLQHFKSED